MAAQPIELELTLTPKARVDAIDVAGKVRAEFGDALARFPRAAWCSFHTTAGYLDQGLAARLAGGGGPASFLRTVHGLFPAGADYRHDRLDERLELTEAQRRVEPRNADSHLAFIVSGMRTCALYRNRPGEQVFLLELDGVNGAAARTRRTRVVGYHGEEEVERLTIDVPVSRHPIDSVNLADPRIGVLELAERMRERHGVEKGLVGIALAGGERDAGVTVNEFETLLMRHDLREVLEDPLRFLARQGRRLFAEPHAIAAKSWGYAKYDVVHLLNELIDALGLSESAVERLIARLMAVPAARALRLKRAVRLLVAGAEPAVVRGTYQSPILIQWQPTARRARTLEITLTRFR
jgi:thiamine phosphate synthase YjbQ (UPF0047 family)